MNVFLSHSRADVPLLQDLLKALKNRGAKVWFDEWSLLPGDSLRRRIREGIEDCDIFMIGLSKRSLSSQWVQHELDSAFVRDIEEGSRFIVVVLVGSITQDEIPIDLRGRVWIDLRRRGSKNYKRELKRLANFVDSFHRRRVWLGSGTFRVSLQSLLDSYVESLSKKYPRSKYSWQFEETIDRESEQRTKSPDGKDILSFWANVSVYNLANELSWKTHIIRKSSGDTAVVLEQIPADICSRVHPELDEQDGSFELTIDMNSKLKLHGQEVPLSGGFFEITCHDWE